MNGLQEKRWTRAKGANTEEGLGWDVTPCDVYEGCAAGHSLRPSDTRAAEVQVGRKGGTY